VGKIEGHRNRVDTSNGNANESRGQTDASMVLNTNEMAAVGNSDDTSAKSDAEDVKHDVDATDGLANQSDMSRGCRGVPGIHNSMHMTANVKLTCWNKEPRSHAAMLNMRRDTWHSDTHEYGWRHRNVSV